MSPNSLVRCAAFSAKGYQCDKPAGHLDAHESVYGREAVCWPNESCAERGATNCTLCGACSLCDPSSAMAGYCYDSDDHKHLWSRAAVGEPIPATPEAEEAK